MAGRRWLVPVGAPRRRLILGVRGKGRETHRQQGNPTDDGCCVLRHHFIRWSLCHSSPFETVGTLEPLSLVHYTGRPNSDWWAETLRELVSATLRVRSTPLPSHYRPRGGLRSECFFVSNGAAAVTCPLPTSRTGHRCARVRAYCSQPKSEHLLTGGVGDVPAWVTRAAPAATARMPSARPTHPFQSSPPPTPADAAGVPIPPRGLPIATPASTVWMGFPAGA